MANAKVEAFLDATIRKTKSEALSWDRVNLKQFQSPVWQNYDLFRSFICSYSSGKMLLACEKNSDIPCCFISPDKSLPFQKIFIDEDDSAHLLRLYNLIYSQFPSVESFMDAIINSTDDPEELPF